MKFGFSEEIGGKDVSFTFEIKDVLDQYDGLAIRYSCSEWAKSKYASSYRDGTIYFGTAQDIGGERIGGVRVPEPYRSQLEVFFARLLKAREAERECIKRYIPRKVRWAIGGDTLDIHVATDEIDTRIETPRILNVIKRAIERDIAHAKEISRETNISTSLYPADLDPDRDFWGWRELEISDIQSEIDVITAEDKREEEERLACEREREQERVKMHIEVLERGDLDGPEDEPPDPYAHVRVTDATTGESGEFTCRNLFDCGYVVNHPKGGILIGGWWRGTDDWPATEFEIKAVEYLRHFPPIPSAIRV